MSEVSQRHLLLLLLINAIWGFNIVAIKVGVDQFPPIFLSFLRMLVAGIVVLPFLRLRRGEMRWLLIAAVCNGGLHFALLFSGVALSKNMSSVAIAGQLGVPFATLLSIMLLGERIRWRRWLGITLAFVGVVIIGFNPDVFSSWAGLALVVASALVGAFGLVAIKRVHQLEPLELQAWICWSSLPILLLLSLWLEDGQAASLQSADLAGIGAVLYTGLAASVVAHTLYFSLVRRYPVTSVAPITVLAPLFSVGFAVWLLGDVMDWRLVAGGLMTLAGVAIIIAREGKIPDAGT